MANQGAKKRKEENARHMARLRYLIIACNVIYVLLRMIIFHSTFTWKNWIGLVITSAAYAIPYLQLANMAKPTYADDGDLLDGGFDMSTGGICGSKQSYVRQYCNENPWIQWTLYIYWLCYVMLKHWYLHDLIFITSFVQITSIISGKFWYTYLVIPGFGTYKSFGFIKGFLAPGSEGGEEDEKSRKKREKMEKRATRGKIIKTRNR